MKIHLNLTLDQQIDTFRTACQLSGTYLDRNDWHGSRTHERAVDVILSGESGRAVNSGHGGSGYYVEAATWDQWGIFLAVIFEADPTAMCGSAKYPAYADAQDFHRKTGNRFRRHLSGHDLPLQAMVLSQSSPDYKITAHRWEYDMSTGVLRCQGHRSIEQGGKNLRAECKAVMSR